MSAWWMEARCHPLDADLLHTARGLWRWRLMDAAHRAKSHKSFDPRRTSNRAPSQTDSWQDAARWLPQPAAAKQLLPARHLSSGWTTGQIGWLPRGQLNGRMLANDIRCWVHAGRYAVNNQVPNGGKRATCLTKNMQFCATSSCGAQLCSTIHR